MGDERSDRVEEWEVTNQESLTKFVKGIISMDEKTIPKKYRTGAIGALLDEYERAIAELKKVIEVIPDHALIMVLDPKTTDENCKSIQTILTHVVYAGYGYATYIQNVKGHNRARPDKTFHLTIQKYLRDLDAIFSITENIFGEFKDEELEQPDDSLKIKTHWGISYDIEQLTEHAIVHILRHRRQIEKFKLLPGYQQHT